MPSGSDVWPPILLITINPTRRKEKRRGRSERERRFHCNERILLTGTSFWQKGVDATTEKPAFLKTRTCPEQNRYRHEWSLRPSEILDYSAKCLYTAAGLGDV